MKTSPNYKVNRSFTAKLVCLFIIIGASSIVSPFIIRSVVDGFLVSQDRSAVLFSLAIVGLFEMTAFGADYVLRSILSGMAYTSLFETKKNILNLFTQKRLFPNHDKFLRTWEVDIKRVVNYEMKQKWLRYKDLFLLFLLSFIMISISSYAGLFIFAVIIVQFALAAWDVSRNKDDIYNLRSTEENEHDYLKSFFFRLQKLYDKNLVSLEVDTLNVAIENASRQSLVADNRRSFLLNLKMISKGFLILGALGIAAFGGVDMSWAAGTFWALLMIVFRLTNPIYSIAQWFFTEKSLLSSKNRIHDLIAFLDQEDDYSVFYQQFKNSIGKPILENQNSTSKKSLKVQIIAPIDQMNDLNSAIRLWSSKFLWTKNKIMNFSDMENLNEATNYFIFSDNSLFKIDHYLKSSIPNSVCVITHQPIARNNFDICYIWNNEKNKFLIIDSSNELRDNLVEAFSLQTTKWKDAFRDIKVYSKLSISFEIVIFNTNTDEDVKASLYSSTLRDVDHLLITLNGHLIYILVASNGIGHLSLTNRLTSQNCPINYQNHQLFIPKRESWKETATEAENFIIDCIFKNKKTEKVGAA